MKKIFVLLLVIYVWSLNSTAGVSLNSPLRGIENNVDMSDTSRVYDLDEVVVVSQPKEAFRLRMQPVSSSVFTGKEFASLGVRDLRDLSRYVPSFLMPEYGSRLTSSMYVRGIGARVNSPAVGMYIDGIPLVNKVSHNFHSYQIDRVDVLRGPQGTLYGMNTEGGLVRLYSKSPMEYQGTDVNIGAGSHCYRNVEFGHYDWLNDKLAMSVAGFYNGQNGFFRNSLTGEHADKYDEAGGKMRLVYSPIARLSLNYIADYQYVRQNGFAYGQLDIASGDVTSPATNIQGNYRRNMFTTGLNLSYSADRFVLNTTTGYQYAKDYMLMDQDYMPQDFMHLEQRQFLNALTQEITFKSKTAGRWKWTTGLYGSYQWLQTVAPVFFDNAFTSRISEGIRKPMYSAIYTAMVNRMMQAGMSQTMANAAATAAIEKAGGISVNTEMAVPGTFHTPQFNVGVFHESNIEIADRLIATIGLRYDYNRVKIDYNTGVTMAVAANVMGTETRNVLSSLLQNDNSNDFNQLLPKFGLTYTISGNSSNIYATVCKGFRAGGYNIQMFSDILQTELNANSQQAMRQDYDIPHTPDDYERISKTIAYDPEESWNYEAGAHLNLFGNTVHADIAAYYMQIRNQQLSVMAGNYGFGRMMVNAGKSHSCGVELSLRGNAIGKRMDWMLNYGYNHSVFDEYSDEVDGEPVSYEGNNVPFAPRHTLGANVDYTQPIDCGALRAVKFGANMSANGPIFWDEANTYRQRFYALLGLHAGVDFTHGISLDIWARNVTNTRYNSFAFDSAATGGKLYFAQRGNPFRIGVDLKIHFLRF